MSSPTAARASVRSATRAAPTAPPAGPESTVHDPWRAAVEAPAVPPLDSITSGSGSPSAAARSREPPEVAAQQRRHGSVHDRRHAALVLAEHAGRLVRGRDVHLGAQDLGDQRGRAAFVLRMPEAPQQADRRRLAVDVVERGAEGVLVERSQHPVRPGALTHRHAQLSRHQRRRVARAQPVQLGPRLAAELLEVREALGGEQRRPRHPPLEQRVRAHGHAVHEALDVAGLGAGRAERLPDGVHHALGLVLGRGGRLAGDEPLARQEGGVGEGAADVHPEDHPRELNLRRRPRPRTRRRGACATGSTCCPAAVCAGTPSPCACWRGSRPGCRRT